MRARGRRPLQGYVQGLQHPVLTAHVGAQPKSNGTCVLVGDDEAFLAEATALAQRELGCKVFQGHKKYVMSSHTQWKFNSLPLETRCTATLNLFTDLEMLAHTDYFVGALLARILSIAQSLSIYLPVPQFSTLQLLTRSTSGHCLVGTIRTAPIGQYLKEAVLRHAAACAYARLAAVLLTAKGNGLLLRPAYHKAEPRQEVPNMLPGLRSKA